MGEPPRPFGRVLYLDLYECAPQTCDDIDLCYRFLMALVHLLNMSTQSPPFIFKTDARLYPDKAGLSGWVPLIESGIQIHTIAPKHFASIDVYSCGEFKSDYIVELAYEYFHHKDYEMARIDRGLRYHEV